MAEQIVAEEWRPVPGWSGLYSVSNHGMVMSDRTGMVRVSHPNQGGYHSVRLSRAGYGKTVRVHRLVAAAFVHGAGDKREVNHIDGNKANNRAENLEWVSRSENIRHADRHGLRSCARGKNNANARLNECQVRIIRRLMGVVPGKAVADVFGVHERTVWRVWHGIVWGWVNNSAPIDTSAVLALEAERGTR